MYLRPPPSPERFVSVYWNGAAYVCSHERHAASARPAQLHSAVSHHTDTHTQLWTATAAVRAHHLVGTADVHLLEALSAQLCAARCVSL